MSNHILYRFFDEDDVLLYIGITNDVWNRWRQHSKTQSWWSNVAIATLEHYENRVALENAEKIAIHNERPKYNVIHNSRFNPDPIVQLLNKVASLEAKLQRVCDYTSPSSPAALALPDFISKRQFLDCTGLTETKFSLLRKYNVLPDGAYKGANRSWTFNRDKALEFSTTEICQFLRLNTIESCIEFLKRTYKEFSSDEILQLSNIIGFTEESA